MLNRNSYNTHKSKHLQKKDLLFMVGLSSILLLFNVFLNNFEIVPTIIAFSSISFILIFYFTKTVKKTLTEKDIMVNMGIIGLCGSIISNLLVAIHNKSTFFKVVVVFTVLTAVTLVISVLLILLSNKLLKKSKHKENNIDITPFALAGSLFGVMGSRYLRSIGIEIPINILIYLLNFFLTLMAVAQLIKARQKDNQ